MITAKENTKPTHKNADAPLSIQINQTVFSLSNITIPIAHHPNIKKAKTIPNPNRIFAFIHNKFCDEDDAQSVPMGM